MNELKSKLDYGKWGQQFTPPYCFELSGKTLDFRFESGGARARFADDYRVIWERGGARAETDYWCLKASDRVYLICFGFAGVKCVTLIFDAQTGLVTLDETSFDENRRPYKSAVEFGAVPERAADAARHGYTSELAGNSFLWIFCNTYWHVESYTADECEHNSNYPDFDGRGPYKAVKISDTLYYVINGDAKESMCMIYNVRNMTSVGRSVVFESSGAPLAQGAVGKYSDTAALPELITVI
jgi:hypothetical protein